MRRIGLLCPTCGMTRSVVLALHGEFARAWQMAPAGPVVVAGLLAAAICLLALAALRRLGETDAAAAAGRWIRRGGLAYAGAAAILWIGGWAVRLAVMWPGQ
jgi:hypothetical protein